MKDASDVAKETQGKPLQGGTGSNNPPGGGGGGAGFNGGGSGLWNGRRAPNNEHGAGGGGSSYVGGPAIYTSARGYPNGNPYYGAQLPNPGPSPALNMIPYNYFLMVIPQAS